MRANILAWKTADSLLLGVLKIQYTLMYLLKMAVWYVYKEAQTADSFIGLSNSTSMQYEPCSIIGPNSELS